MRHRVRIGWMAGAVLVLATGTGASAAGGHHAVDDATLMDTGTCEGESWYTRSQASARLLHAGIGCRAGPVEFAIAGESARQDGNSQSGWQAQVKWAAPLSSDFAVGASVTPSWQARAQPGYQGTSVAAIATWTARDSILVHLDLGRDIRPAAAGAPRSGVAVEWSPRAGLSVVGERYTENRARFFRAGLRWSPDDRLSIDASHALQTGGRGASNWTVGVTRRFDVR